MRRLAYLACLACPLAALAAAPIALAQTLETARVSDERTSTWWAPVAIEVPVRAAPSRSAKRVGALRPFTYHGLPDVVLVLRETSEERPWTLVRYPGLGRRTGWVPADALGPRRHTDRQVVIDRARTRLRVLAGGEPLFSTRVAVGASGSSTPAGRTYLRERVVPANPSGAYGVLAFGLSSYSPTKTGWPGGGQVGIHGTNQPGLIPGRISNGCVRLTNAAIRRLDRLTGVGTPVLVR